MEVRERVNELIAGYLEQNGIELIEIIYRREHLNTQICLIQEVSQCRRKIFEEEGCAS